jgi:uncharacterized membrane protein (Fun14 family)
MRMPPRQDALLFVVVVRVVVRVLVRVMGRLVVRIIMLMAMGVVGVNVASMVRRFRRYRQFGP